MLTKENSTVIERIKANPVAATQAHNLALGEELLEIIGSLPTYPFIFEMICVSIGDIVGITRYKVTSNNHNYQYQLLLDNEQNKYIGELQPMDKARLIEHLRKEIKDEERR